MALKDERVEQCLRSCGSEFQRWNYRLVVRRQAKGPRLDSASALPSLQKVGFVDSLVTLSLTVSENLKWLSSLPVSMHESLWWWQCSGRCIISLSPHLPTHFPPFSPSLISLVVSVDVKHHVGERG